MLNKLAMWIALFVTLGSGPLAAQQQEAVLQRMRVSGANFDILLAIPRSPPQWTGDLDMSPDALVIHLTGSELVVTFEDTLEMLKVAEILRSSVSSSHWVSKDGKIRSPLAVYVVPKTE